MIYSMTGYGSARNAVEGTEITVDIRSLNSKHLDANIKLPSQYRLKEIEVRNLLTEKLMRGKVDLNINLNKGENEQLSALNQTVVKQYARQLAEIEKQLGLAAENHLSAILRMPNVIEHDELEENEDEWKVIFQTIELAVDSINVFRLREGEALQTDLLLQLAVIEQSVKEIKSLDADRHSVIRNRVTQKMNELVGAENFDRNRFEQEMIFYLEKMDITEELVRLSTHCTHFRETLLLADESIGKKLGFISQEMGREINTIGSKANNAEMQAFVILAKDALEKIKEQTFNIR